MSAARWSRLQADLAAAGFEAPAGVYAKPYSQVRFGRVEHGVSRSMTLRVGSAHVIQIADRWWSKNDQVWIGWEVALEDREGFEVARRPLTKRRSQVVECVRGFVEEVSR